MILPNPETLLADISAQIKTHIESHGAANCALVGIHSGGVWLMDRILKSLKLEIGNGAILNGTLDAAMYRDDYNQRGLKAEPKPANISFDVTDKHIILIDDIFYTGRTTRAAMNELFDYGRPASIILAVLINRGGAELPIAPQIVGAEITLKANQNLQLSMDTKNKLHLNIEVQDKDANA